MSPADRDDHQLAHDLAAEAGELLVEVRARLAAEGATTRELKDGGDRRAHELLLRRRPFDGPRLVGALRSLLVKAERRREADARGPDDQRR